MPGLVSYGAYVPYHRLQRKQIAGVLGAGGGGGARAVASYDEDTTSLAVEAGRIALRGVGPDAAPRRLYFATAGPAYLDKTNAAVVHAALNLDGSALAVDMNGSVRSGVGAVLAGAEATVPTLVVLSDIRTGLPGSADERDGGDGAAALLFGPGSVDAPVLAELLAVGSTTDEFLDRWRTPGAPASKVWEERFGEHVYGPLAAASFADACKQASLTPGEIDHLVVSGLATRAVKQVAKSSGVRPEAVVDDRAKTIGNAGTAQAGILLADVLDRATPGAVIAVVVLADGATTFLLRTTDAVRPSDPTVASQIADCRDDLSYGTFLTWRGFLDREPPRRPDPDAPAAPPTHRSEGFKYGFRATRCDECGTLHLPPGRVCISCGSVDAMTEQPMAEVPGTISTYTIDRLAFTPSPPMVAAVVDFDGGGRFRCELTDVDADAVAIGDRVTVTFRKMVTANGVHNYFWKARPERGVPGGEGN